MTPERTECAAAGSPSFADLTGGEVVAVLQEAAREANSQAARVLRLTHEAARSLGADTTARADEAEEFGADEVRVALVLSHAGARRRVELAESLVERLPEVLAALEAGLIDEPRARAFVDTLRDADDDLAHLVCARVLPEAPGLVLGALIARLEEVLIALDPDWAARREAAARRRRRVRAWRNPAGTATLAGYDLPFDRVVGGVARLEALAAAALRAGARGGIDALRADAYLGAFDGTFAGLDDDQIIFALLEQHSGAGGTEGAESDEDADEAEETTSPESAEHPGSAESSAPAESADGGLHGDDAHEDAVQDAGPSDSVPDDERVSPAEDAAHAGTPEPGEAGTSACDREGHTKTPDVSGHGPRPGPARARLRTGTVEIRGPLTTLLGAASCPGEIAGWGPVTPGSFRALVRARKRAEWRVVVVDGGGHLVFVDLTRRRPTHCVDEGRRNDIVELWVSVTELDDLEELARELAPGWVAVCRDITARFRAWQDEGMPVPGDGDEPDRRFPRAALGRWVAVRDRCCIGPGCTLPAHAADLDHTVDHAFGGPTRHTNLDPMCKHDHRLKHEGGWELHQVAPGRFVWISRCGQALEVPARPVRRDLPPPSPRVDGRWRKVSLDLEPLASDDGDPTGRTSSTWLHRTPAGAGPGPSSSPDPPSSPDPTPAALPPPVVRDEEPPY